jgi:hypothetical protein
VQDETPHAVSSESYAQPPDLAEVINGLAILALSTEFLGYLQDFQGPESIERNAATDPDQASAREIATMWEASKQAPDKAYSVLGVWVRAGICSREDASAIFRQMSEDGRFSESI